MSGEWISITEAATRLSFAGDRVERSSLSRYLQQHQAALPLRREGKTALVNFQVLVAHRAENIRLKTDRAPAYRTLAISPGRALKADGVFRRDAAVGELRQMDVEERRQRLTPTFEVQNGIAHAIEMMQAAYVVAASIDAADLSEAYGWDETALQAELLRIGRIGTAVFSEKLTAQLLAVASERDDLE